MPTKVRRVAEARRRAPEQTFGELAQDLDMSRSQVQRAFEMIGSAALHTESP
jgi:AraC-like DNA-binding protein